MTCRLPVPPLGRAGRDRERSSRSRTGAIAPSYRRRRSARSDLLREYRTRLIADVVTGQARCARGGGAAAGRARRVRSPDDIDDEPSRGR